MGEIIPSTYTIQSIIMNPLSKSANICNAKNARAHFSYEKDFIDNNIIFSAHLGLGYITLFKQYYSADLPPLSPHCGEAPGRDTNPSRVVQRLGC